MCMALFVNKVVSLTLFQLILENATCYKQNDCGSAEPPCQCNTVCEAGGYQKASSNHVANN